MPVSEARCEQIEGCITCGDMGVAMSVRSSDAVTGLAVCATDSGECSEVETALVGPLTEGDSVLVHAGTAIARLDRAAA